MSAGIYHLNGAGPVIKLNRTSPLSTLVGMASSVGVHDGWDYGKGRRDTALLFRSGADLLVAVEDPPPEDWADQALEAGEVEVRVGSSRQYLTVLPG